MELFSKMLLAPAALWLLHQMRYGIRRSTLGGVNALRHFPEQVKHYQFSDVKPPSGYTSFSNWWSATVRGGLSR